MSDHPKVTICEMAPRDGLQALDLEGHIPVDMRVRLVEALQKARLPYIEVGSFVNPQRIPSMRETAAVAARLKPYNGELAALVPNKKYYSSFAAARQLTTVALFVSASEAYSLKNTRMTTDEALVAAEEVAVSAVLDGYKIRAHVSGAFRDLTDADNPSDETDVEQICKRLREIQCGVIALADTDGKASEDDIRRVIGHVGAAIGLKGIGVHLHERDGNGLAKARAAYECGVRLFDAAIGGIGGNRSVGMAAGNIATEALVHMLDEMGVDTGIDSGALTAAGQIVSEMAELVG